MFNNMVRYAFYISKVIAIAGAAFFIIFTLLRRKDKTLTWTTALERCLHFSTEAKMDAPGFQGTIWVGAMLTSLVCVVIIYLLRRQVLSDSAENVFSGNRVVLDTILNAGLAACLVLGATTIFSLRGKASTPLTRHPLAPYAVVFFASAVFHNLSVTTFRWRGDNNPLIALAALFVASQFAGFLKSASGLMLKTLIAGFGCACLVVAWADFFPLFNLEMSCTEQWPEVRQLAGARLRPECEGIRSFVRTVQSLADKSKNDTVLLLPDDPNVEAWIDRERPAVSSAILFADQYWDRYVDPDFAALQANPPKVIVIGPRNYWRKFSKIWHWKKDDGVIRLIDRVQKELLPQAYDLREQHRFKYQDHEDFMDVYVRRSQ